MPLGMEVGLGPHHIVLDGDPAPHPRKGHSRTAVPHLHFRILRTQPPPHFSDQNVFGRPIAKRFALWYRTVVLSVLSVCNVGVLWPKGWMLKIKRGM